MTARFAGSRSLDDRRRRRLAQESCESEGSLRRARGPAGSGASADPHGSLPPLSVPHESLIPRSPWKIGLIGLLGLACGLLVLWLGQPGRTFHPPLAELLDLERGGLARFFSTLSLLLAAQLSFLILWYRSRCRKDFSGRYRIWGWTACFWGIACLSNGTQLHVPLGQLLHSCWPIDCWRPLTISWLVPFAVGVLAVHRLLAMEMRQSRLSRFAWSLTFWSGVLAGGMQLGLERALSERAQAAGVAGLTMLWHFLVAMSLLIHARFVIHVTNEAAPREGSRLRRLLEPARERMESSLRSLRRWRIGKAGQAEEATAATRAKKKAEPPKSRKGDRGKPAATESAPAEPRPERGVFFWRRKRVQGKNLRIDPPQAAPPPHSQKAKPAASAVHPPPSPSPQGAQPPATDEESLHDADGRRLSKKERRRRRKLERR